MRIVVAVAFSFFLLSMFLTLSVNPTAMNAAAAAATAFLEKKVDAGLVLMLLMLPKGASIDWL